MGTLGIAIVVFLWLTLGCFAAGLAGNVWIVIETLTTTNQTAQLTIGLWRNCSTILGVQNCTQLQPHEFLTFKNIMGTDPIMICLIISSGCTFIVIRVLLSAASTFVAEGREE